MRKKITFLILAFIASEFAFSQVPVLDSSTKMFNGTNTVEISQPHIASNCGNKVRIAASKVQVTLNYSESKDTKLKFLLKASNSKGESITNVFNSEGYDLQVSAKNRVAIFEYDLKKFLSKDLLDIESVSIIPVKNVNVDASITFSVDVAQSTFFKNPSNLRLPSLSIVEPILDTKSASFEWECTYPFTKYEIEILKLENTNPSAVNDSAIVTSIDWSQALRVEYDVDEPFDINNHLLTSHKYMTSVTQGTGYYAWRVRPIGSYFDAGIANSENWGEWSTVYSGEKELVKSSLDNSFFYFEDPNQDLNYSNSKIFSEGNRVKEVQSFADGLSNVRQIRTYIPSTNTTISLQSINDYAGRKAISSLPIPMKDQKSKYSPVLLANSAEYSAENFDKIEKVKADKVDNSNEISYYEGNSDQNIPDAELIPFTQTQYYGDPLNRVKQEGGPGEMFQINNADNTKNKNTKYYYGVASESELVRLFGDKTPLPNTINKVISEDANGVSTISYQKPDGSVLATCLSFSDKNTASGNLQQLDKIQEGDFQQVHILSDNEMHEWGYSSSKRFVIMADNTNVSIDYTVENPTLFADCAKVNVNCNYKLEIAIFKVDEKNASRDLKSYTLTNISKSKSGLEAPVVQELEKGTYIVEKRLLLGEPTISKEEIASQAAALVKPMPELTKALLYNVKCKKDIPLFQRTLRDIRTSFKSQNLNNLKYIIGSYLLRSTLIDSVNTFIQKYGEEVNKEGFSYELYYRDDKIYRVLPETSTANAELIEMRTPCCRVIVPVKWIKRFDTNVYPKIQSSTPGELAKPKDVSEVEDSDGQYDFLPDFEGYAMAYFRDCDALNGKEGSFRQYMGGWEQPGIFNYMIYHMLTDKLKPYVDNSVVEKLKESGRIADLKGNVDQSITYDCSGRVIDNSWLNGVYDTKTLFNCWDNQLRILANAKGCNDFILETDIDQNANIASKFDEQVNNDKSIFDSAINKVFKKMNAVVRFFTSKRKFKRKLIKKIRSISANPSEIGESVSNSISGNIVKGFLDCAGYSFVKIVTPYDAKPLSEDADASFQYEELNDVQPFRYKLNQGALSKDYFEINSIYKRVNTQINSKLQRPDVDFAYVPIVDWKATNMGKDGKPEVEHLLPRIKNPIYAFKYFEYPEEGFKETQEVESNNCYTDLNDCYSFDANNFYIKDEVAGGFKKVSCCGVGLSNSVCYKDFAYPNLDLLYKPNDPRFTMLGDKKARLIVNDFDGNGRIKCPYDHTVWSSGQRYTYYVILNKLFPSGINSELEKQKEKDEADYAGYELNTENTYDCNFLKTPHEWYVLPDEDGDVDLDNPVLIPGEEKDQYPAATQKYEYSMPNGERRSTISTIEMLLKDKEKGCLEGCDMRYSQFRDKLRTMLVNNCYQIDECRGKGSQFDHVISSEEIDAMAAELVKSCKSQCSATTFGCTASDLFRSIRDPKGILGGKANGTKLFLGIAGMPSSDPRSASYKDAALDAIVKAQNSGSSLIEYDLSRYKEDDFSWYEYTAMEQATSWDFEVNLPCKCSTITLQPQKASEVYMALKTSNGVEKFGSGDFIRFDDVDFGRGFDQLSLNLEINYNQEISDNSTFNINIFIDGNLLTQSVVREGFLVVDFPSTVKGVHTFKLEGVGNKAANCTLKTLILSLKNSSDKSNARLFSPTYSNTFVPKDKYEYYKNAIRDNNDPSGATEDVVTPAKSVKVIYDNEKKN
jgi:hypothetical protein